MKRRSAVRLNPETILFPNTFVSTTRRFTFTISNQTDKKINYTIRSTSTNSEEKSLALSYDIDTSIGRQKIAQLLNYKNDFFQFEPSSGELWPRRVQQIVVSFTPYDAMKYAITSYLFIHETNERIPISVSGLGIPPSAQFSVTSINTGPVALESILEYQVFLQNTGEVPVTFSLVKRMTDGIEFQFNPESGIIPIHNKVPIAITFLANQVRQFNETFSFQIGDSSIQPSISLFGRVIGPVFSLSTNCLDFGRVSLGTINTKTIVLENKSLIPFDFKMRAGHDGSFAHREINITPAGGFIDKFSKETITVEFIPTEEKEVNAEVYLDILKFGEKLRVLPLKATVIEPKLKIEEPDPDIGLIYIGHKTEHIYTLINDFDLVANFYFEPCDDVTQVFGDVDANFRTGTVKPKARLDFPFYFTPKVLGQFKINGRLKICGSDTFIPFSLSGISAGPKLVITPDSISLGKGKVLKDIRKIIKVENQSPIPANYKIEIDTQFPVFTIDKMSGVVPGNETEELTFVANLDDSRTFTGNIIIRVEYLHPIVIPIKISGTGVPIVASIPMDVMELGPMLTEHSFTTPFSIENKGMRKCSVMFSIQRPKIIGCNPEDFYSAVTPAAIEIEPGESIDFEFTVRCPKQSEFTMLFQCHATLGNHRVVMYTPKISGSFIHPKLLFSTTAIDFKHFHDFEKEEELSGHDPEKISPSKQLLPCQKQEITVTNLVPISVKVTAYVQAPYHLSQTDFNLEPNSPVKFTVTFDPQFKTDFISENIIRKIIFSHGNHSIKFNVNVTSEMYFPNIDFTSKGPIDFGLMLINTERSIDMHMKNANGLATSWDWELLPEKKSEVSKIFDIFPIRGHMKPGGTDVVHFSFVAQGDEDGYGTQHTATAVCHVKGGPDYTINLVGNSSNIDFRVDPVSLDFGNVHFLQTHQQKIILTNLSDAAITYETLIPRGCQLKKISVSPMNGSLKPETMAELTISILPGLPRLYKEKIIIRIARIQDVEIPVTLFARFEQIELSIPRCENDPSLQCFNNLVVEAQNKLRMNPQTEIPVQTEEFLRDIETKNYLSKLSEPQLVVSMHRRRKKDEDAPYEYRGYVNSRYQIDMGRIVFGDKRVIEFSMKNATYFPLSAKFVLDPLKNTGFKITPSEFTDLDVNNQIDFKVTFDNNEKKLDFVGDISFEVPLLFSDDFGVMFQINASTETPALKLSQNCFDFGNVIIGQYLTMTVQLQNMNPMQLEYEFGVPKSISEKEPTKPLKTVFSSTPSEGTLPSQTFQNIEIAFSPNEEMKYALEVPILIPHTKTPTILQILGVGVRITLSFDPPILNMPPILPFNEPSTVEVTMFNNSDYPIEVFSYQFDFLNYVNERLSSMGLPPVRPSITSTSAASSDAFSPVSKFALCVIVHGVSLSGRTTVSKIISSHLDDSPILYLKDIWADLLERNQASILENDESKAPSDADYVSAFQEAISDPSCTNGFVLDGLDVFPEPEETEQFLGQCLRHKGSIEEITRNPFTSYQHQKLTASERALSYVLAAFDGHYVFLVALKCTEDEVTKRIAKKESDNRRKKRDAAQKKREELINMTEAQYDLLDMEAQEEADKRRKATRDRIIKAAQEALEEEENAKKTSKGRSRSSSKKKHHHSGKSSSRSNPADENKAATTTQPIPADKEKKKQSHKSKYGVPLDPIPLSILTFNFTLGTIVEKLLNGGDAFQVVDPNLLIKDRSSSTGSMNVVSGIDAPDNFQQMNSLLINGCDELSNITKYLNNFLPSIQQMKEKAFTRLIPKPKSGIIDFTHPKKAQVDRKPEFFSIITEDLLGDLSLNEVPQQPSSSRKSGRSSRRSRNRNDPLGLNTVIPFIDELDLTRYTPRWNIEPHSSKYITVMFSSYKIGKYTDSLNFGIPNCKFEVYKLKINGSCIYPEINREISTLFTSIVNKFTPKVSYSWVNKLEAFHCGYLLITNPNPKQQSSKTPQSQYKFPVTLKNESEFQADISCSFSEPTKSWIIDQPNLSIKPLESSQIMINVFPTVAEVMNTTLQILIKDNPTPLLLPLIAEGTLPLVEMTPNSLDFERVMLKQSKTIDITLTNNGKIPCEWALKHSSHLGPNITFNQTSGVIQPKEASILSVTFQSPKPMQLKKNFQLEVFDNNRTKSFSTTTVAVIAEAYDTHFDVIYPKGMAHLMFGMSKVNQSKTIPLQLKNRSKYPVHYAITLQGSLASSVLKIDQPDGIVAPGEKMTTINVTFLVNRVVKIENKKMMTLRVNDPLTNTITNVISVCVSAETVTAKLLIDPQKIDFGAIPVLTAVQRSFTIKNNGSFPFNFDITAKADPSELMNSGKRGRGRGRGRGAARGRGGPSASRSNTALQRNRANKKLGPVVDVGYFMLQPSSGVVPPGQATTVNVDFHQATNETFKATAIIKVTDSPEDRTFDLDLLASTYVPGISNGDYEQIFKGQHLCLRSDVTRKNMNAFLEDEHIFHFAPLILHDSASIPVYLINPFPIPCTVDVLIKPKSKAGMSSFPFDVSEKLVNIPPNGEYIVNLSFSPVSCDNFIGYFEANVKGGTIPETKQLKFCVEGAGALPGLTLLTHLDKPKGNTYNVPLGRVLMNGFREKTVAIRNDAFIPATVKISVRGNNPEYTLKDADNYIEPILLETGRTINITAIFSPQKAHRSTFEVVVSCADNPKGDMLFIFSGEGFIDDVVFDGSVEDDNDILFRDNVVGRQQQCTFRMRNICKYDVRFAWANNHDFQFLPRVGHLKAGQSKQILVTFFTEKPVKFNLYKIPCQWTKIELDDPYSPDWDDTMKTTEFIPRCELKESEQEAAFSASGSESSQQSQTPNPKPQQQRNPSPAKGPKQPGANDKNSTQLRSQSPRNTKTHPQQQIEEEPPEKEDRTLVKVVKILPEPPYKPVNVKLKDLVLRVFAISDVIKYSIDTTDIPFAPTMMYQTRTYDVKVTNTSQIKFEYQWTLEKYVALRNRTMPTPFSIQPSTGVINAGQSKIFKVLFSPEEVDDFTATFKMSIPYLQVMEAPLLNMSGFSRRPLCHFNVKMSDYISAGRRHPSYNDPLPEGVKVVELFSKGVGKKIVKKFEIINPTSSPYEITWTRVQKGVSPSVKCLVSQALVSSGKRYSVGFSYLPTSVKTVESLWLFSINEHNIHIHFLIVGRIMPQ
ncbi:hypothetical protein TRFO_04068 [Tritrichomonas foetus]|uniref:MSP domain-containing protein n=1 Tax=Tritrichomonas foetus TaxID=1144522 RepID=A0A1J4KIB3_9EUKA|nr:hypothetical protein TRFO_04068 [Tritrichomonas foetus]|eukprot:OHT11111.1 hypothetical protein TRFO_04068 [Tritrichomonas foetus]